MYIKTLASASVSYLILTRGLGLLKLADTVLILINPCTSNVNSFRRLYFSRILYQSMDFVTNHFGKMNL